MDAATQAHVIEAEMQRDPDLARLYGCLDGAGGPYPLLVEPWEDEGWDFESELDAQIFAGLLRLAP
jgi:hypothetical protein